MENIEHIRDLIYLVRGVQVMLDADLAEIYGYTTKAFNQQVKNNIAKFDDDFRFQLTKEEHQSILKSKILTLKPAVTSSSTDGEKREDYLMSKNLTSSWGGTRELLFPKAKKSIYNKNNKQK